MGESQSISRRDARRIALAAQGFGRSHRTGTRSWSVVREAIAAPIILQLDSVSALTRSHYVPAYARIGPYPTETLDARAFAPNNKQRSRRVFFEYWAHEASLVPMDLYPLFRWRMERAANYRGIYSGIADFARDNAAYIRDVLAHVRRDGPLAVADLDDPGERSGPWWGWQKGKTALEYLFWTGEVTVAERRGFERIYDVPERVIPNEVLNRPMVREPDAILALVALSAKALGIAARTDLRDYFRLPLEETDLAIAALAEEGLLLPAKVDGWKAPAWLHRDATLPKRMAPSALLSPFDSLVWERGRTERLFDFAYRLEFYTPAERRRFGYYVMPFLSGDRLVARVDIKADRPAGTLHVLGAFAEPKIATAAVARSLAEEIERLARWLALERIAFGARGDLMTELLAAARAIRP